MQNSEGRLVGVWVYKVSIGSLGVCQQCVEDDPSFPILKRCSGGGVLCSFTLELLTCLILI